MFCVDAVDNQWRYENGLIVFCLINICCGFFEQTFR